MMRILLAMWFIPLALFWAWYGLSANDISFGTLLLSREIHDVVIRIYSQMLGVEPWQIPGLLAAACAVDSAIVLAIVAFRWRAAWLPQTKALAKQMFSSYRHGDIEEAELAPIPVMIPITNEEHEAGRVHPAE